MPNIMTSQCYRILTSVSAMMDNSAVRTTVSIDDDLLAATKSIARAKSQSLGRVLSDLARRGLNATPRAEFSEAHGFPVFRVPPGARTITIDDVKKNEDEA
jgi:hypothetical protein